MPQMAPLSWLTLMLSFITIFLIFNLINFSINLVLPKTLSPDKKSFLKFWKW
uniref:ATP synthase complex subunit 8 n=1 Tax=Lucanus mazama TaxID=590157 RepID=D1G5L2_9SCAR|nr:ATP synthase F0 subunit 8 [Lucanus mazama]ACM45027.1 ATP synthase F0 subunit 8 [Lucanus mazama]